MRRLVVSAGLVLLTAGTAAAQGSAPASQNGVPTPPVLASPQISLADAVRTTLQSNADVARANQALRAAAGRAQQSRGLFDTLFSVTPAITYDTQQVSPSLLANERQKRAIIAGIAQQFMELTVSLDKIVAAGSAQPPRCPANFSLTFSGFNYTDQRGYITQPINVDRVDPAELTLLGTNVNLPGTFLSDLLGGINVSNFCTNPAVTQLSPELYSDLMQQLAPRIDQSGGLGLNGLLQSVAQIPHETRALQDQITRAVATRAFLALERLGPLPIDQFQRSFSADLNLTKPTRTGMTVTGTLSLDMSDGNFTDKPYDSSFGGYGLPPAFTADLSGTLRMPLGRGAGRTSVAATERAALLGVTAQRESARHTMAQQAYRTTLAYLNVVAAKETLRLLQESAARQGRVSDVTRNAVESGDIARVEQDRASARAQRVNSAVSDARVAVLTARASLAEAMGVSARTPEELPDTTETFATLDAQVGAANDLIARALASRLDVRAARARLSAAETLAAGARRDMRRTFDFVVTGGLSNRYDSPTYKYMPDEVNPIIPASDPLPSAIHYYSPTGFWRAIKGRWEPYVVAQLEVSLPFGNHAARGRFAQASASASSSRIQSEELGRSIGTAVADVVAQLDRSAASLRQWETATRSDNDVLAAAQQRLQERDETLINALLTEETVTSDYLALVQQRQVYFSTLARLHYELGALVNFEGEDVSAAAARFDAAPFVAR